MQKWEYKKVQLAGQGQVEDFLNGLGQEGWEFVAIEGTGAYLKRPIIKDTLAIEDDLTIEDDPVFVSCGKNNPMEREVQ